MTVQHTFRSHSPDVIVIGLGAVGSAALYQLARRGICALGLDRHSPPHSFGSSHGETRVTRVATGEGEAYVALARRSHELWRELEAETGRTLLRQCGFLTIDGSGGAALRHGKPGFFDTTVKVARRFGVAHELLSPAEVMARHPAFRLKGDERCYYEPGAGSVYPERVIAAQLERALALGARVQTDERVLGIASDGGAVCVRTEQETLRAARMVIAAGAWTPGLVGAGMERVRVLRQVLHWLPATRPEHAAGRMPTFLWLDGPSAEDSFYGIPVMPDLDPAVKVATEQYTTALPSPDALDREVTSREQQQFYRRYVAGRIEGVGTEVARSAACLYTHTPTGDFIVDRHPGCEGALIVSACSGHGFKHSSAVGELVAGILTGSRELDPDFALRRAEPT